MDEIERQLRVACETANREAGCSCARFLQMIDRHGAVEATKRVLRPGPPADGFVDLAYGRGRWRGRPELTVEAIALLPEHASLFTDEELQTARDRLPRHPAAR